jgi:hypothetical protein
MTQASIQDEDIRGALWISMMSGKQKTKEKEILIKQVMHIKQEYWDRGTHKVNYYVIMIETKL